jgi:hypothetical protein
MSRLLNSLNAWQTEAFYQTMKKELEQLAQGTLPLEKAVMQGGYVDDSHIKRLRPGLGSSLRRLLSIAAAAMIPWKPTPMVKC